MKKRIISIIVFLSFFLLFISIINKYMSIKLWDYDLWWHLSTGKYIVETKTIPDKDPFSFVNKLEENKSINPTRERYILKKYWLAQVFFYKIYDAFGDKGIIILRSLLLFATIFFVFSWFKRNNVSFYIIYPLVFLVFSQTMRFTGERPVLFTVVFTVLIFFILDDFKQRKSKIIFALVPLMLLWANMHGGFILGIVFIGAFMAGETLNYFIFKKGLVSKKALMTLLIVGIIAIAVSAVNPNGFDAFLTLTKQNKMFQAGVQEYFSPFTLYKSHLRPIDWEYIALVALFPVILALRNKKIDIVHLFILCGLLYMSVTALRFIIYYVCIGTMIIGKDLHCLLEDYFKKVNINKLKFESLAAVLIFISSLLFTFGFLDINRVTFAKAVTISVPKGAADFIESHDVQGNMFNDMGFGGYLIWRLYPKKQVFIDTRQLNYAVMREFEMITLSMISLDKNRREPPPGKKPLWERILDHYDIDLIIIDTIDVFGGIKPLIFSLIKNDSWAPVYGDFISVVFVRNNQENQELIDTYRLPEDVVYSMVIVRLTNWASLNKKNPQYLLSLGDVFFHMGKYEDALKAYRYADKRYPNKEFVRKKIDILERQLEKEEGTGKNKEVL